MRTLILSGRLGANAEVKVTKTGTQFIEFRMANNEYGDEEGQTYWFRVTSFNPRHINLAPHLTKGKTVEVVGSLRTRGYVNATTNKIEVGHDITASEIMFDSNFGRPQEEGNNTQKAATAAPVTTPTTTSANSSKKTTRNPATTTIPTPQPAPVQTQAVVTDDGADDLPF